MFERISLAILLSTASVVSLISQAIGQESFRVVGYVQNDFGMDVVLPAIEIGCLTHVNLSFENPRDLVGTMTYHENNDRVRDAAHRVSAKVLVAIGGGAAATDPDLEKRYAELLSVEKREAFAKDLVAYVNEHQLDGIDVDLEGPAITESYGPFIHILAMELKKSGKTLSAALSHTYGGDRVTSETLAKFDFVNVMAYNETGPWNPNKPGQHSSIELAKNTTNYWIKAGLPKSKIVLGLPFYGYGFGKDANNGIAYRDILVAHPEASAVRRMRQYDLLQWAGDHSRKDENGIQRRPWRGDDLGDQSRRRRRGVVASEDTSGFREGELNSSELMLSGEVSSFFSVGYLP